MIILIIALAISMDAFSLALIYGILNLSNKKQLLLSLIVGLFHLFMPLLGNSFGLSISKLLATKFHLMLIIILIFIGIEMIISSFKPNKKLLVLNYKGMLLFALAVSIDSFTLGISLKAITNNYTLVVFIFFIVSSFITFLGLKLGQKINHVIGQYATIGGGIILIVIAILNWV